MGQYKLARTKFNAQTADEAADHASYYQQLTWQERAKVAHYLNSIAFNFRVDAMPKMDKTKFKARSRN